MCGQQAASRQLEQVTKLTCSRCFADLEWKLIYVGSPESEKYDQTLDSVLVGPVAPGSYRFVFQVSRSNHLMCVY